ncbi:hypothetical protein GQ457_06G005670 [Hibiscus cannabinus]
MATPPPLLSSSPDDPRPLLLSYDRNFALHGEITMLVILLLFAAFLSFLLLLFYTRLSRGNASRQDSSSSDPVSPDKFGFVQWKS